MKELWKEEEKRIGCVPVAGWLLLLLVLLKIEKYILLASGGSFRSGCFST